MGNLPSNENAGSPRMAISAMADMMKVTKTQFIDLREACLRLVESSSKQNENRNKKSQDITREEFHNAMKDVALDLNDADILDHLYTIHDKYGEDKINLIVFLSGISPLASTMDVGTKLLFAFQVWDIDGSGRLKIADAKKILLSINATASYFGDPVLTPKAIDILVDDVYKEQSEIFFDEYIDLFLVHPAVVQFVSSAGTVKYKNSAQKGKQLSAV